MQSRAKMAEKPRNEELEGRMEGLLEKRVEGRDDISEMAQSRVKGMMFEFVGAIVSLRFWV